MSLLASQMREEMQEELGHSEEFMNRIMFLKGDPELTLVKTPVRASSLKEMFEIYIGSLSPQPGQDWRLSLATC